MLQAVFLLALHTMRTCTMHHSITPNMHLPIALHHMHSSSIAESNVAEQDSVYHCFGTDSEMAVQLVRLIIEAAALYRLLLI